MTSVGADAGQAGPRRRSRAAVNRLLVPLVAVLATTVAVWPWVSEPSVSANAPTRIMPLGDSNTRGWPLTAESEGYRRNLEQRLVDEGRAFEFVGTEVHGPEGMMQKRHQGISGMTIEEIYTNSSRCFGSNGSCFQQWFSAHPADVILLMAGTNNVKSTGGIDTGETAAVKMDLLIGHITTVAANSNLVVSTIPPQRDGLGDSADFNSRLPAIVEKYADQGRNVSLVDSYAKLIPSSLDFDDNLHLNSAGYAKVATVMFEGLEAVLDPPLSSSTTTTTSPSTTTTASSSTTTTTSPSTTTTTTTEAPPTIPPTGDAFTPLGPARLLDTRSGGVTVDGLFAGRGALQAGLVLRLPVTGRAGARVGSVAASVNMTVLDNAGAGFATLFPCGAPPNASTINFAGGVSAVANGVIVPLSSEGEVCVFVSERTQVLIDLAGVVT